MERLSEIYESLLDLCVSIRKLGPKRRGEKVGQRKFQEADNLYNEFTLLIEYGRIRKKELHLDPSIPNEIEKIYRKILGYKEVTDISESSSDEFLDLEENKTTYKMESFSLKTASTLIPVMDGKEETVERIIEGIEMYESCLKEEGCKKLLVSFVLKTRLSKIARLKLKKSYETISGLVHDIQTYLLTKKSSNSMITQINNISQNNLTIGEYGQKLGDLFTSLTIAQADGNQTAAEILSPINERLVVKRFADGLRNRRLSTILAARNYSQLKDAVRAAEDEELSLPGTSGQDAVFSYTRGRNSRYSRSRGNYHRGQTTPYRGNTFHYRGNNAAQHYRGQRPAQRGFYRGKHYQQRGYSRPPNKSYYRSNRGHYRGASQDNVNIVTAPKEEKDKEENLAQFFRSN